MTHLFQKISRRAKQFLSRFVVEIKAHTSVDKPDHQSSEPMGSSRDGDIGGDCYCPLCESSFTEFIPGGPSRRPGAKCPQCGSLERHRSAWLYFAENIEQFNDSGAIKRFLHFAPEKPLEKRFRALGNVEYISADLEPGLAMRTIDMTSIDMPDEEIDLVFCSHVLEHIESDFTAMSELHRILKQNGELLIQVPMKGEKTYEDFTIRSPEGRREAFGQEDHVRIYGSDITERLSNAGFNAKISYPDRALTKLEKRRMNTGSRPLIICTKPQLQENS